MTFDDARRTTADYWEDVRKDYAPFETGQLAASAEVYLHEMPGGQYANLYQQAQSLGVGDRWHEVGRMYAAVNKMFGDIVKVTPTSKVVGDMALFMLANNLTPEQVLDPKRELAFPESVVEFFEGKLGQPPGGFPEALQKNGAARPQADDATGPGPRCRRPTSPGHAANSRRSSAASRPTRTSSRTCSTRRCSPTSPSTRRSIRTQRAADADVLLRHGTGRGNERRHRAGQDADHQVPDGGRPARRRPPAGVLRAERPAARGAGRRPIAGARTRAAAPKAEPGNPQHVAAPMPGAVVAVAVGVGEEVAAGQKLLTLEAMKMETTLYAERAGRVAEVVVEAAHSGRGGGFAGAI